MIPTTVRLNLFGATLVAALAAEGWGLLAVVGFVALALVRFARHLRGFVLFALVTVALGTYLFAPVGQPVPSLAGAIVGLAIVGRALAILLAARWVAEGATAFEMARLGERVGLRWLGFALGVAINALPDLEASARRTWDAMRLRGGFRRHRLRSLRLLAVATLTNALHRADAQAEAATARGLGLAAPRQPAPPWRVGHYVAVAGAWAVAATLLATGR